MKQYVIDSSTAIKWLFLEKGSDQAEKLLEELSSFFVPDLFLIELDAVISKKVRQKKLDMDEAFLKSQQVRKLPYEVIQYEHVARLAFEIAISLPVTLYDATYVAVAIEKDAILYTADKRLVNGLSNTLLDRYVESIWDMN